MADIATTSLQLDESCSIVPLNGFGRALLRCREADTATIGERTGINLPQLACRATAADGLSALWLGPDEWLLFKATPTNGWTSALEARLDGLPHSLVDVSHRQIALSIRGDGAERILASGCALDLSSEYFPVDMCTRTMFAKVEVVLWRTAIDHFHMEIWRSYARYVRTMLREAEREMDVMRNGGRP